MDEKMKEYIMNDIITTHIICEKVKADKTRKQVRKLSSCFIIVTLITAKYIAALISNAAEQNKKIETLTEAIKELTSAKGE